MGIHKNKAYPLRIEESIMKKIAVIAETNHRTRNKEIEYVLEEYVKNYEAEHGIIPCED